MRTSFFNKNIYLLAATNCINTIYNIFFSTFLISFLFTKTKENITDIGIFYMLCFGMVGGLAYLTGNWIKRGNRLLMYQLGIVSTFLFFVAFLFLQDNLVHYIPVCGAVYGLIMSFKSFPYNLIVADNIPASKIIAYKGYVESLKNILKIITPIAFGVFLTNIPYFRTIGFLVVLSVVEFALFSQIKASPQKQLPAFNIRSFLEKTKYYSFLKHMYKIEFCRGMTIEGTLKTIITLYIIYLFKTDFNLGLISSLFYGITIVLSFIFGRKCDYRHFVKILMITALFVVFSLIIFILKPAQATFIIYNLGFVVAMQFLLIIADISMFNISNLPEIKSIKNEYFVVRELFLNLGRLVSYVILLIACMYDDFVILKYLLGFFTIFLVIMCYNCIQLNRYFLNKIKIQ